jgi:hypothetical protein
MKRKEEWRRPDWVPKIRAAVEVASVDQESSRMLIGNAEDELQDLKKSLQSLSAH